MLTIGTEYTNITYSDITDNYKVYAEELLRKKILCFRNIELDHSQHLNLLEYLADGGEKPSLSVNEMNSSLSSIYPTEFTVLKKDGMRGYIIPMRNHSDLDPGHIFLDPLEFFKWSVHMDTNQQVGDPNQHILQAYTTMYMWKFDYDPSVGKTKFCSLIDMYNKCPIEYKEKLINYKIEEWRSSGTEFTNIWSPFHMHPITNEIIMFWPTFYIKLHKANKSWFNDLTEWVKNYLYDENNWFIWSWKEKDFIIFDNRCLVHAFEGGWDHNKRIFSQGGIIFKEPIELTELPI